jgi:S1-C subfamily serine protease
VVRADDLAVAAIEKNGASLVRIKRVEGAGDKRVETLLGLGLVVSKEGHIAADAGVAIRRFDEFGSPIPRSFLAMLANGMVVELAFVGLDEDVGLVLFLLKPAPEQKIDIVPTALGDSDALKLAQTVISLGGGETNAVGTGIIANLPRAETPDRRVLSIYTDREAASTLSGTALLNLSGEVVGLNAGIGQSERSRYLPANALKASVEKIKAAAL